MQPVNAAASPIDEPDLAPVKLSCRALWKVFGTDPEQVLANTSDTGGRQSRIRAIREAGHIPAVSDVSFDVREGEILVLMGLSGSGKSTVLRCLSRPVEATYSS